MVNTVSRLQRLDLSAKDIQSMVDWPDALIEDYLGLLRNLIEIAELIDIDIFEIEQTRQIIEANEGSNNVRLAMIQNQLKKIKDIFQQVATLQGQVGSLKSQISKMNGKVFDNQQEAHS
jgi:peptidoglycan hydrolase CwlO-like protein